MKKQLLIKVLPAFVLISYFIGCALIFNQQLAKLDAQAQVLGGVKSLTAQLNSSMSSDDANQLWAKAAELVATQFPDNDTMPKALTVKNVPQLTAEFDELIESVSKFHYRSQTELRLLILAAMVGLIGLMFVLWRIGQSQAIDDEGHTTKQPTPQVDEEFSQPSSPLAVAIHNISQLHSIKSGHDYILEIQGDETLSVTDANYPLIEASVCEMVSNAIVHGGRVAAIREAAGKPSTIKVFLGLRNKDGVWTITLADDGEGIDEIEIIQHAIAKGMLEPDTAKNLDSGEGVKLILADGFSDAKNKRSGPLKSNSLASIQLAIQAAGGSVSLRNRPGVFCEFTIKLPS